jgi:hypothetical protein
LHKSRSRLPLHVIAAAPGTLHAISFFNLLSGFCFYHLLRVIDRQSALLVVPFDGMNSTGAQRPIESTIGHGSVPSTDAKN